MPLHCFQLWSCRKAFGCSTDNLSAINTIQVIWILTSHAKWTAHVDCISWVMKTLDVFALDALPIVHFVSTPRLAAWKALLRHHATTVSTMMPTWILCCAKNPWSTFDIHVFQCDRNSCHPVHPVRPSFEWNAEVLSAGTTITWVQTSFVNKNVHQIITTRQQNHWHRSRLEAKLKGDKQACSLGTSERETSQSRLIKVLVWASWWWCWQRIIHDYCIWFILKSLFQNKWFSFVSPKKDPTFFGFAEDWKQLQDRSCGGTELRRWSGGTDARRGGICWCWKVVKLGKSVGIFDFYMIAGRYGEGFVENVEGCKLLCMARAECTGFELRRSLSSAFGKPTWVARKSTSWLQINLPGKHEVLAMFMLIIHLHWTTICDQGEESNRCSYWMGDTLSPSPAKGIHCYSKVGCLTCLVKQRGGCELSKFWGWLRFHWAYILCHVSERFIPWGLVPVKKNAAAGEVVIPAPGIASMSCTGSTWRWAPVWRGKGLG